MAHVPRRHGMTLGKMPGHNMKAHSLTYRLWVTGMNVLECASSCDVLKRAAAPADAKTRKSAESQVLVTNTKTERREVSGCSAPVSQPKCQ